MNILERRACLLSSILHATIIIVALFELSPLQRPKETHLKRRMVVATVSMAPIEKRVSMAPQPTPAPSMPTPQREEPATPEPNPVSPATKEVCKNTLPVLIEQEKVILQKADTTICDAVVAVATTKEQSAVDVDRSRSKPVSRATKTKKTPPMTTKSKTVSRVPKSKATVRTTSSAPKTAVAQSTKGKGSKPTLKPNRALLDDALCHLDSSASQKSGTKGTKRAHLSSPTTKMGKSATACAVRPSSDEWYISDLIRRLQLHIRLHDPGVVRVVLTIKRDGSFRSLAISSCPSSETRRALEGEFPKIQFAPFGKAFYNEREYTFHLRLEDAGIWVTS